MQEAVVALIVAYAAWVVTKHYAPETARTRVRSTTVAMLRRIGFVAFADRLQAAALASASCADGCSNCGGCASTSSAQTEQQGITVDQLRRTIPR